MRYKTSTIVVKPTNPKKNPNLYEHMPYAFKTGNNTEYLYKKREEVVEKLAEHLVNNPYKFVVLKNKLPEEKVLVKTLEGLVKDHNDALEKQNLILRLGSGKRHRCIKRAKKFLEEAGKK